VVGVLETAGEERAPGRRNAWRIAWGEVTRVLGVEAVAQCLERERARWAVWAPVAFGAGIAAYFLAPAEPGLWAVAALPVMAAGLAAVSRGSGAIATVVAWGILAAALGFATAKLRTESVRAPVLAQELRRAEVVGVVELVEPLAERGERLTVAVHSIARLDSSQRPTRIRVRMMQKREGLAPGMTVRLRATLRRPAEPALPGGYDFARWAWFQGIGATGYAIQPAEIIAAHAGEQQSLLRRTSEAIERLRQAIGERIRAAVPGETGAIAVSLITGERGAIPEETNDAYRDSGLVHILSISGLHMVVMAGAVYGAVRTLLALFPAIALRFATKKWAAAAALLSAGGYLMISGGSIPTVRAFLMIAIMFAAVMLDRQALAMRNVAIAALLILVARPESLLDAGFQMSFAAVASLIAAYEAARERSREDEGRGWLRAVAFFLGGILLSTVIASLAVAPFGAYHFHRSQQYALLANLIAVPVCNLVVMPAALLTLALMPFGLEAAPLAVMAKGIDVMTATAYWVAALPGAVVHIPAIPTASFALMVAGGLWLTIWQTRWRVLGLVAIGAGVLATGGRESPDLLVGRGGELAAIRAADGRLAALGTRAGSYDLKRWLEHDGDGRAPREALAGRAFRCDAAGCTAELSGLRVAVTRHPSAVMEDCSRTDILIAQQRLPEACTAPRLIIDRRALWSDGAHAVYVTKNETTGKQVLRVETVASQRGARPWSTSQDLGTKPLIGGS
jgi:competence protein ComEC